MHQSAHQITAALLEPGQLIGFQTSHRKPRHLIDVAAEIIGQLLARGLAGGGENGAGGQLEQALHQGMAPIDQQHMVVR